MTVRNDSTNREGTIRTDGSPEPPSYSREPGDTRQSSHFFHTYHLLREFPAAGGEADIWLVQKDRDLFVLKQYRRGIVPNKKVLGIISRISGRNPQHLIRIFEHGYDEESGRWYEILEYARYGSLKELLQGEEISRSALRTIIEDISASLNALHDSNILHLDLKPSNILIRSLRPLDLILTDFGISSLLDTDVTRHITTTKGTPMYWAPEQMGNLVGKEADFWALGVIILEILQKKHPFDGLNHHMILSTLSTRGIVVPDDIHPEYSVLLKGLLTRNPKKRWGKKEISYWLSGRRNIPVYYEQEQVSHPWTGRTYEFRNEQYDNLVDLMYAFISDPASWEDAKRHIGRGYLTKWLESTDQFDRAVMVEKFSDTYPDPDERLLNIAAQCNREIPFTLFGKLIDVSSITSILGRYLRGEHDEFENRILMMLISGEMERIYLTYSSIVKRNDETSMLNHLFSWLTDHPGRGIDGKQMLYDFSRTLQEREAIGSPFEWDTKSVLRVLDIRNRFYQISAYSDAAGCEHDLIAACDHALESSIHEPDLFIVFASVLEEMKRPEYKNRCLKKASESDIKVITLLFSGRTGLVRFRMYNQLIKEYETNLYALSSDPWRQAVEFWFGRFFILVQEGQYSVALSVSERIIEMNRESSDGWAMRGYLLAKLGRPNEAGFFFANHLVQNSDSPLVWQLHGEYYEGLGKYGEAEKKYKISLEINPSQVASLLGMIRIYLLRKRFWDAVALCNQILEVHPDNVQALLFKGDAYLSLKKINEAMGWFNQVLKISPGHIEAEKKLARCQVRTGRYDQAEGILVDLIKKEPDDPEIIRLMSYLLIRTGKKNKAVPYLEQSLEKVPDDIWSLKATIDTLVSLRQYYPALRYIDRLLSIHPEYPEYSLKKGKIYLSMGFYSLAAASLQQAAKAGLSSPELFTLIGDAIRLQSVIWYGADRFLSDPPLTGSPSWHVSTRYLDLWNRPDPDKETISRMMDSVSWYEKALVARDNYADAWNGKGIVSCILQDYRWATEYFETAIRYNEKEPAYLTNLGSCTLLMDNINEAEKIFAQAVLLFPKNEYLIDQYAHFWYRYHHDPGRAMELLTEGESINRNTDPIILQHLYIILRDLGREEDAKKVAEKITAVDPWFIVSR